MQIFHFGKPKYATALFLSAMKVYPVNMAIDGTVFAEPKELSQYDRQFLRDRMADNRNILKITILKGLVWKNSYTPTEPFTVNVTENSDSYAEKGYVKLFVKSSGADSPRPIVLRHKSSTNQCFFISRIRKPVSDDPWK